MTAGPRATLRTRPAESTATTSGAELVQVTRWPDMRLPAASRSSAVSRSVSPDSTPAGFGELLTDATPLENCQSPANAKVCTPCCVVQERVATDATIGYPPTRR